MAAGFDIHTDAILVIDIMVEVIFMFDVGLNFRTTVVDATSKETVTNTKEISIRFELTAALLPVSCFQLYFSYRNFDLFLQANLSRDEGGQPSLTVMYYSVSGVPAKR